VLTVTEHNTTPLQAVSQSTPAISKEAHTVPKDSPTKEFVDSAAEKPVRPRDSTCARCGKPFRGDWDRNPTHQGTLCHICSRLVTESSVPKVVGRVAEEPPAHPESYFPAEPLAKPQQEIKKEVFDFARNHPRLFRGVIIACAAAVVGLAIYFALFGDSAGTTAPITPAQSQTTSPIAISKQTAALIWVIRGCFLILGNLLALYLASASFDRLPGDTLLENVRYLFLPSMIVAFFGFLPCVGALFAALILYGWFDFEFRVLAVYFVLHIFAGFVAWHAAFFVVGLLGFALT